MTDDRHPIATRLESDLEDLRLMVEPLVGVQGFDKLAFAITAGWANEYIESTLTAPDDEMPVGMMEESDAHRAAEGVREFLSWMVYSFEYDAAGDDKEAKQAAAGRYVTRKETYVLADIAWLEARHELYESSRRPRRPRGR